VQDHHEGFDVVGDLDARNRLRALFTHELVEQRLDVFLTFGRKKILELAQLHDGMMAQAGIVRNPRPGSRERAPYALTRARP
jgi:hypothetical protein